jgi:hypothetical protein
MENPDITAAEAQIILYPQTFISIPKNADAFSGFINDCAILKPATPIMIRDKICFMIIVVL